MVLKRAESELVSWITNIEQKMFVGSLCELHAKQLCSSHCSYEQRDIHCLYVYCSKSYVKLDCE